ncbi:MAG: DUF3341 domain-containing protein [Bdellovibrionales bacterium]
MAKYVSGVVGFLPDDRAILKAAKETYSAGFRDFDTLTPFPIHGMDQAMGLKRSWIPWVTFFAGLTGFSLGLWFTWWTSAVDYPINVGGKPMFSLPAFIPVLFELTILFGALASVATMFLINGLPKVDPPIIDPDITCHKFALFIPETEEGYSPERAETHLQSIGATDIRRVAEF